MSWNCVARVALCSSSAFLNSTSGGGRERSRGIRGGEGGVSGKKRLSQGSHGGASSLVGGMAVLHDMFGLLSVGNEKGSNTSVKCTLGVAFYSSFFLPETSMSKKRPLYV